MVDACDPFKLCVRPEFFDQQMAEVARRGGALPLDRFVADWREGRLEPGSIVVTFDDGYLDVFEEALPILEKYEIPATVFVVSGSLGRAFWWDRLAWLLRTKGAFPEESEFARFSSLPLARAMECVYPRFRQMTPERREAVLAEAEDRIADPGIGQIPEVVSADRLREVARHPLITIGAHTATHSQLAGLDFEAQKTEIMDSIRTLSAVTGRPVRTFSYPFGLLGRDFDGKTIRAVEAAGLDHALAADLNVVNARSNPFALPRLWVHNRSGNSFQRQMRNWLGKAPASPEPTLSP